MNSTISETVRSYLARAEPINVDTTVVEKNRPFRIVKRANFKNKDGVYMDVYIITLPDLDPRWTALSPPPFQLFSVPGTRECVAKIPMFDYSYLHDPEAEKMNKLDSVEKDAVNITRNQVLANPDRFSAYYRLIFPEFLNNEIFSASMADGKVKPNIDVVEGSWSSTKIDDDGNSVVRQFTNTRIQIDWKIAVHEDQKRHSSALKQKTNELMDGAEEMLGSMSIS